MSRGRILVTGSTGVLGSHVVRELAVHGWRVRAMTHRPDGPRARAIAGPRIDVVAADVRDPDSLLRAVDGVDAVFLLEPWRVDGADGARTSGVAVANAAAGAGVGHVVFSSLCGAGASTGVAHLERKRAVELHLKALALPTTVLRPVLLMERMASRNGRATMLGQLARALRVSVGESAAPLPAARGSTGLLAPLVGRVRPRYEDRPVQVVSAADVATVARLVLEEPSRHRGLSIDVAGDELTAPAMAEAVHQVTGGPAPGLPGVWTRREQAGPPDDLTALLEWLRDVGFGADLEALRTRYPWLSTFPQWLLGAGSA